MEVGVNWTLSIQSFLDHTGEPIEFVSPASILQTEEYQLVLDGGEGVFKFDSKGMLIEKVFEIGQGPKEIAPRTSFMMLQDGHVLLVADTFNGRIQWYDLKTRTYDTKKTSAMNFVVNGIETGDSLWFGGINSVFKLDSKGNITHIPFSNDFQSINLVGFDPKGRLIAVSMITSEEVNELPLFSGFEDGSAQTHFLEFEKTKEIETWANRVRLPLLLTGMISYGENCIFSTKVCNREKEGLLLIQRDMDRQLAPYYLKDIELPILFHGNKKNYLIDSVNSTIYLVE